MFIRQVKNVCHRVISNGGLQGMKIFWNITTGIRNNIVQEKIVIISRGATFCIDNEGYRFHINVYAIAFGGLNTDL